jgi:acetyl esterase/lipase
MGMKRCLSSHRPMLAAIGLTAILMSAAAVWAQQPPAIAAQAVLEDHYPPQQVNFAGGVVGLSNLVYSTPAGFRPLTLDLYLPPAAGGAKTPKPLVIYIHGGGWSGGHSRNSGTFVDFPGVLASLAAKGYVVASLNYRLSGEAKFPAAEIDVKTAIRWLRTNAGKYGIDKTLIAVWGGSAGGHLAALTATTCGVAALEPPAPPGTRTTRCGTTG